MATVYQARLEEKAHALHLTSGAAKQVNWNQARLVTPGQVCGYETSGGLKIASPSKQDAIRLFQSGEESQALFYQRKQVIAGTVTSKIETQTKRSKEKKATHIQYDKTHIVQAGKDFQVDAENYRSSVNYDGGHIIDHKFSAEASHTTEENYFPQHFYYNQTIKEFLVKKARCDDFIEIPLYTPNPPTIGVKGKKHSHPIPIAIIFVQIQKNKIRNVYCFPNTIDYKTLSQSIRRQKAATLASYFRLDPILYDLLRPAIITNYIDSKKGHSRQSARERQFLNLLFDVSEGMSMTECHDVKERITQLSSSVLHEENVDPKLCISEEHYPKIENESLTLAFNTLGTFLVKYGIKNALKTEVLSINSRLIFCNVIIDFIEYHTLVSKGALDFIATLAKDFYRTLEELERLVPSMNEQEHLFLINTTLRLSSHTFHHFADGRYDELYDSHSIVIFVQKTVELLRSFLLKFKPETFSSVDVVQNIISITTEAKEILNYLIETEFKESIKKSIPTFNTLAEVSSNLLAKQPKQNGSYHFRYQRSPRKTSQIRTLDSYLEDQLEFLSIEENTLDFIAILDTLEELKSFAPYMNKQELLFLIHTTLRLSSDFLHALSRESYDELYDPYTTVTFLQQTLTIILIQI